MTEETKIVVYRNTLGSCNMFTTKGKRVAFIGGRFATSDAEIIAYLDGEIANGNQFLRHGTAEDVAAVGAGDPLAALRKKFFQEYSAHQARIMAEMKQGKDQGTSVQGALKTATTKDIAAVTLGR
jgi:hypothetical protein